MVFLTKYNNQLPNIGKAIDDNWNHLHINSKISSAFTDKPIVAYKRNDNLRSLIGQHEKEQSLWPTGQRNIDIYEQDN